MTSLTDDLGYLLSTPSPQRIKQVILIRRDLKMRRGKEIAQGAHASIAFMTNRLHFRGSRVVDSEVESRGFFSEVEFKWIQGNFRKVTVMVHSEEELLSLVEDAKRAGVVAEPIQDSGYTEFHGVPTWTAAAIGPDYDEKIDPITGHLELY